MRTRETTFGARRGEGINAGDRADLSLAMLERLYLRLDGIGARAEMFWVLDVDGPLDPEAVAAASIRAARELPPLATRVVRRPWGYAREPLAISPYDVLTVGNDDADEESFYAQRIDLRRGPSFRLYVRPGAPSRLVVAVHHSAADGFGSLLFVERMGAQLRGAPLPPLPVEPTPRHYRHYYAVLPPRAQLAALSQAVETLRGILQPGRHNDWNGPCASFFDAPLPAAGALRPLVVPLPWSEVAALMRAVVARRGTVVDALIAATAVAGRKIWRDDPELPVVVSLPVGLRNEAARDAVNRTVNYEFMIHSDVCGQMADAFRAVAQHTVLARGRQAALVQSAQYAVPSVFPPRLFELAGRDYFKRTTNTRVTFTLTSMGTLRPVITEFGAHPVVDCHCHGTLRVPPGLSLAITPSRRALNIAIHTLDPVTSRAHVDALIAGIRRELAELVVPMTRGETS